MHCRGDRVFSELYSVGKFGPYSVGRCPSGQKLVGYAGLDTCDGPDLFQVCSGPRSSAASVKLIVTKIAKQVQDEGIRCYFLGLMSWTQSGKQESNLSFSSLHTIRSCIKASSQETGMLGGICTGALACSSSFLSVRRN